MRAWPVGTTVYVVGNCNNHNYTVGKPYIIAEVDDDGTFRARDLDSGNVGNWLRWQDVDDTPPIGWQFCKGVLPPEIVTFLEAFDGIDQITLRDNMKGRLLRRLPNLHEAIVEEANLAAAERVEQIEFAEKMPQHRPEPTEDAVLRFFASLATMGDEDKAS